MPWDSPSTRTHTQVQCSGQWAIEYPALILRRGSCPLNWFLPQTEKILTLNNGRWMKIPSSFSRTTQQGKKEKRTRLRTSCHNVSKLDILLTVACTQPWNDVILWSLLLHLVCAASVCETLFPKATTGITTKIALVLTFLALFSMCSDKCACTLPLDWERKATASDCFCCILCCQPGTDTRMTRPCAVPFLLLLLLSRQCARSTFFPASDWPTWPYARSHFSPRLALAWALHLPTGCVCSWMWPGFFKNAVHVDRETSKPETMPF